MKDLDDGKVNYYNVAFLKNALKFLLEFFKRKWE